MTDFDDDLHEKMPFQKSHFFLLQISEWLINTATYARESQIWKFVVPIFCNFNFVNSELKFLGGNRFDGASDFIFPEEKSILINVWQKSSIVGAKLADPGLGSSSGSLSNPWPSKLGSVWRLLYYILLKGQSKLYDYCTFSL